MTWFEHIGLEHNLCIWEEPFTVLWQGMNITSEPEKGSMQASDRAWTQPLYLKTTLCRLLVTGTHLAWEASGHLTDAHLCKKAPQDTLSGLEHNLCIWKDLYAS